MSLFLVYRCREKNPSRRDRLAVPVAFALAITLAGYLGTFLVDKDIVAFVLMYPLPTLAIFTLLPIVETVTDWRGRGRVVAAFSICYSVVFFWYYVGSALGGIDMIFPRIFSPLPTDILLLRIAIVTLVTYLELVAIAGVIVAVPCLLAFLYHDWERNTAAR